MRGVLVNSNGPAAKGVAELNYHMQNEQEEVRDGVDGDGQGLSEEDESRIIEDDQNVNHGSTELVQAQAVPQRQQLPQGPLVCWEQFLPVRSLKVLLVENDDSTRHVVSALLRNCSYEVTAVANGMEAWDILQDLTNHVDLVLTEVVMPCLSGIGLLYKIMNHKTCKNIPVIMMSSNDSMGIVFKCLSKGAVDFLVKPIRKNELKNLWQHVWRKCHSSSGSGSESGTRTQKYMKSKSGSANDSGSNDEDDHGSIGLNVRDGSDNGSGTQSSWSKRAVEVQSPRHMLPWDNLEDPPDSTCAQVIHVEAEAFSNNWVPATVNKECHKQDKEFDNIAMGKNLEIGVPRNSRLQFEEPAEKASNSLLLMVKETNFDFDLKSDGKKSEINGETQHGNLGGKDTDLIGVINNHKGPQRRNVGTEIPTDPPKFTHIKGTAMYDTKQIPSLELSLKRLQDVGDTGTSAQERNVLRQSNHSAFSRYNMVPNANQVLTGNVGSCSFLGNSSEEAKIEPLHNLRSNSNVTPNQLSNGSSNNNDMGSTTDNIFTKPEVVSEKLMAKSTVNAHPCSVFQPKQNGNVSSVVLVAPGDPDAVAVNSISSPGKALQPQIQVQHHHHYYHHYHHHVHNMQQHQALQNHDNLSPSKMTATARHCGPSNLLTAPIEGNAANYGSASGSNNGSNGQNGGSAQIGSCSAAVAEGTKMEIDNGVARDCGVGDASECGSGLGVDQNRFSQREAALNKFRQKRKERCFEKKVRYQSRKKLAEQRPRVRGQFVRQPAIKDKDTSS